MGEVPQEEDPADLRFRAAQAASLLTIVLEVMENSQPEVLAALHGDAPGATQHMCQMLLEEALSAAAYEDVSPKQWFARLEFLGAIFAYLVSLEQLAQNNNHHLDHGGIGSNADSSTDLASEAIGRLWQCGAVEHTRLRPVLLQWLSMVLKPKDYGASAVAPSPGAGGFSFFQFNPCFLEAPAAACATAVSWARGAFIVHLAATIQPFEGLSDDCAGDVLEFFEVTHNEFERIITHCSSHEARAWVDAVIAAAVVVCV